MDVRTVLGDRTERFRGRKPVWLEVHAPGGLCYRRLNRLVRLESLHTVCQQAACPIAARPAS
jgi:lipoate synthase